MLRHSIPTVSLAMVCARSGAGDLASELIWAEGDADIAMEAIKKHLPAVIETFTGDASVTRQLLDKIGTCFVSGNDADPVVLRILEDHIMLREADDDDKVRCRWRPRHSPAAHRSFRSPKCMQLTFTLSLPCALTCTARPRALRAQAAQG
jgi:hypothetical protein